MKNKKMRSSCGVFNKLTFYGLVIYKKNGTYTAMGPSFSNTNRQEDLKNCGLTLANIPFIYY